MEPNSEILITLESFNSTGDGGFSRTFTLNPAKTNIEIGRASKTTSKGLAAAKDNAWFESPIMSRRHAEFTLSKSSGRVLYLKDLKSTHGTFVDENKLKPEVEYTIKSGDIITFGQKVTSGTSVFPAKVFCIKYEWQHWSNPTPVTTPEAQNKMTNPGFHCPSDSDSDESDVGLSREPSLEITGPPLKTIVSSTPGSAPDPIDLELATSSAIRKDIDKGSIRSIQVVDDDEPVWMSSLDTTKPTTKPFAVEPRIATTNSSDLGSSQAHPITLEDAEPKVQHAVISDSEDEGPEALPISQAPPKLTSSLFSIDHPFRHYLGTQNSTVNIKDADKQSEIMVAESDTDYSDAEVSFSMYEDDDLRESELDMHTGDTPDQNWSDEYSNGEDGELEDEEAENEEEVLSTNDRHLFKAVKVMVGHNNVTAQAQFNTNESISLQPPRVLVEDSQLRTSFQVQPTLGYGLDPGQGTLVCEPWAGRLQRAPSPSDAALVKPPSMPTARSHHADGSPNNEATLYPDGSVSSWPQNTERVVCGGVIGNYGKHPSWDNYSPPMDYCDTAPFFRSDSTDREISRYKDGPFSECRYDATPQLNQPFGYSCRQAPTQYDYYGPWRIDNDQRDAVSFQTTYNPMSEISSKKVEDFSTWQKKSETKTSKLPISDIVNTASSQSRPPSRALKRKLDEMESVELPISESAPVLESSKSTQDSLLSTAQSCNEIANSDTILHSDVLQPPPRPSPIAKTAEEDGPARKKIRSSSGNSRPFKVFLSGMVSGVFVGAVSIVGACAAFLATIPDTVKDEARREFL